MDDPGDVIARREFCAIAQRAAELAPVAPPWFTRVWGPQFHKMVAALQKLQKEETNG